MRAITTSVTIVCQAAMLAALAGTVIAAEQAETGWPGDQDYKVRFIRLSHEGQGWNDGMGQSGADRNFLTEFNRATGFATATKGEAHRIGLLAKYPDDGIPPFVYLTGNAAIGRTSQSDIKALRRYCLKGGMLIADAGSPRFHQSFGLLMRSVFPDHPLVEIPTDDSIFRKPHTFPQGPPAFWHHGGRRPLGIKHEGRWIVFYHPGDMNDAWKSEAYAKVTPEMRKSAINLGINLVYYSFVQWNKAVLGNSDGPGVE